MKNGILKRFHSPHWLSLSAAAGALFCIAYLAVFTSPFKTREVFNPEPFAAGPWQVEERVYTFYKDGRESLSVREEDSPARRYLRIHIKGVPGYSGIGFQAGQTTPEDASLVLLWRTRGTAGHIQLDITDAGPAKPGGPLGEVFSTEIPPPGERWTRVEIPLKTFKRNENQRADAPKDGRLDTGGIHEISVTLPPYSALDIDIRDVHFKWGVHRPMTFYLLAAAALLGLLLHGRRFNGDRGEPNDSLLLDAPAAVRIIHFLTVLSLITWAVFYSAGDLLYSNTYLVYGCFLIVIFFDQFAPARWIALRMLRLRYFVILSAGYLLGVSFDIPPLFLLLLACYIPGLRHRDRGFFMVILAVSLLGLAVISILEAPSIQNTLSILLPGVTAALISEGLLRSRAAAESKRSMSLYEDLFTHSSEAIYVLDSDRRIQTVNRGFQELAGQPSRELIGRDILDFIHPGDHPAVLDRKPAGPGNDFRWLQLRFSRKDGEPRTVRVSERTLFRDDEITGYQLIARDITESQALEERLRQAQKMEAVGQLAGGIAHDFNNLLQVILGYTEMATRRAAPGADHLDDFEQIETAAGKAVDLTQKLLLFSSLQTLKPVHLDLNAVITDISKMIRRIIGEHIEVDVRLSPGLQRIYADPTTMDQILMNLCVNARDAMPEGGKLTVKTENTTLDETFRAQYPWAKTGEYVLLTVSDTGIGMSPEVLERIFEPFFTTKEIGKGAGLGLSTVYGIVKQHKGHIICTSRPGEGACFRVFLPVSAGEAVAAEEEAKIPAVALQGSEAVLVAEDDDMNRKFVTRLLREWGYTVLAAADGEEALKVLEEHADAVDLAILDVVMPKMGGKEIYDLITAADPSVRFLFISGYQQEELSRRFSLDKSMPLLRKPFTPRAFLEKVRQTLDAR